MSEFSCDSESDSEDEDGPAPHAEYFDEVVHTQNIKSTLGSNTAKMELYLKLSKGVVIHKK